MLISEPRYAAAYQSAGAEARVFDDIGCLLDAARAESKMPEHFWFRDANDDKWIEGTNATFVRSTEIRTPMSGGITAYRTGAAAEKAAGAHRGQVLGGVSDLFAAKAGQR